MMIVRLSGHPLVRNSLTQSQNEKEIHFMLSNNKFVGKCGTEGTGGYG